MYRMIIGFSYVCLLMVSAYSSDAKPYQAQVKGGYGHCVSVEYRAQNGQPMSKTGMKRDSLVFDENGNQIEMISFAEGKIAHCNKVVNRYNEKGQLSEYSYYSADGRVVIRSSHLYDNNANLVSSETKDSSGKVTAKTYHKYDRANNLIQTDYIVIENDKEVLTNSDLYKNDINGNMIVQTNVQANGSKMDVTYKYVYDNKKNIIKMTRTSFDDYKYIKEFKYDRYGNVTEELFPDEKGKIVLRVVYNYTK